MLVVCHCYTTRNKQGLSELLLELLLKPAQFVILRTLLLLRRGQSSHRCLQWYSAIA